MPNKNRILVIEDNCLAQKIAQMILNELSCIVDIAPSGQEALNLLMQHEYDLVFIDIGLPDIDGCSITLKLRSDERFATIPIIGLSVHANANSKALAIQSGMNAYITKPLTLENCMETLKQFLSHTKLKTIQINAQLINLGRQPL